MSFFSTKVIFLLRMCFSEKRGLTVFQNILLSVILFVSIFSYNLLFSFLKSPTQKFRYLLYSFLLVTLGFLRYLFRMRDLVITALERVLFIKGALLALKVSGLVVITEHINPFLHRPRLNLIRIQEVPLHRVLHGNISICLRE